MTATQRRRPTKGAPPDPTPMKSSASLAVVTDARVQLPPFEAANLLAAHVSICSLLPAGVVVGLGGGSR